jgi:hypothetical protein
LNPTRNSTSAPTGIRCRLSVKEKKDVSEIISRNKLIDDSQK